MQNRHVRMVLPSLDGFPEYELPEGYRFRGYVPGDCDAWVEITAAADNFQPITHVLFADQFGGKDAQLARRMFFICHGDEVVGTSTAWFDDGELARGRVHWVAIHPDYQGRGLAKPLLCETLRRLREFGHSSACLETSTGRTAAIGLYRKFGFVVQSDDN
jgi:ribosomal protein S18 acetylase RimI-like enzyme